MKMLRRLVLAILADSARLILDQYSNPVKAEFSYKFCYQMPVQRSTELGILTRYKRAYSSKLCLLA